MTCAEFRALFSDYYDNADGAPETRAAFEAHLSECAECAAEYADYAALLGAARNLPEPPVPSDYHARLMNGLRAHLRKSLYERVRPFAAAGGTAAACFALVCVIAAGVSGMFGVKGTDGAPMMEAPMAMSADMAAGADMAGGMYDAGEIYEIGGAYGAEEPKSAAGAQEAESNADSGALAAASVPRARGAEEEDEQTALYDYAYDYEPAEAFLTNSSVAPAPLMAGGAADISVELSEEFFEQTFTVNIIADDFDRVVSAVENLSGYPTNAATWQYYENAREGQYSRRVDAAAYTGVKETLRGLGEVTYEYESVNKLADQVYDLRALLAAKEDELERLTALLRRSLTMDVLVAVERRLSAVEYERDDLRGILNRLYDAAAFPYLNINIYERPPEPEVIPEDTFTERLSQRFIRSVNNFVKTAENFTVWLISALPPLLVVCVAVCVVFGAVRLFLKRKSKAGNKGGDGGEK